MPAPLARGILFSISLLVAAGFAVYEHPQIRQWIDENRRKLALALHGLGDDVHPGSPFAHNDVSLHEDHSPEAAERRRIARQAILDRAREAHERRGEPFPGARKRGASFDDLVDVDGKLRDGQTNGVMATGVDQQNEGSGDRQLRNRSAEAAGATMGVAAANPFADEMATSLNDGLSEEEALERATRESRTSSLTVDTDLVAALAASVAAAELEITEHSNSKAYAASTQVEPHTETACSDTAESQVLVDLTPTTSRAPSSFHPIATPGSLGTLSAGHSPTFTPWTPRSTASAAFHALPDEDIIPPLSQSSMTNFQSIHEWAESSTASFYSPPESEAGAAPTAPIGPVNVQPPEGSERQEVADVEIISRPESRALEEMEFSESELDPSDALSEAEVVSISSSNLRGVNGHEPLGVSTPGSWTELGSVVSEEEH